MPLIGTGGCWFCLAYYIKVPKSEDKITFFWRKNSRRKHLKLVFAFPSEYVFRQFSFDENKSFHPDFVPINDRSIF